MTLVELRTYFPHTERTTYLNHAATGVLSRPVVEAVEQQLQERHRSNINNYEALQPVLQRTKERLARLIHAAPERVAFAPNTSYGLNVLARGFDWQPDDRVAVPGCEFPANVYPFLNLERQGVEVDFIPHEEGTFSLEDIRRTLRPETRLLTLSWVQFLSGFRADLEAVGRLCQERDLLFCVDAIQGLGALQLDVEACGIDFLACGSHKWLMGTQGLGFLYVTEALQERITPAAGWLHGPIDWDRLFDYELAFHDSAERFRLGTLNHLGVVALDAALELYEQAGPAWCEEQVLARARQLADGIERIGLARYGGADRAPKSGIVAVKHPAPEALFEHLAQRDIEIALRNQMLRFSPTYYNTPEEIEAVLQAVSDFRSRNIQVDAG